MANKKKTGNPYLGLNIYNQTTKKVLHFNDVVPFLLLLYINIYGNIYNIII